MRISDWRSDVCSSDLASSNPLTRRLDRASRCYRGQKCKRAERTHLGGRRDNRGHPSWWFFRLELRAPLVDAVLFQIAVRQFSPRFSVRSSVWRGYRSEEYTSELQSLMRISSAVFCLTKNNITFNGTHLVCTIATTAHLVA